MKTQKKCIDCGGKVSRNHVKRCLSCRLKWAVGKNASNWRGGNYCLDCKIKISKGAERCISCSNKRLMGIENNPRSLGKRWKLKKPRKKWDDEALRHKATYMRNVWADSKSVLNSEVIRKKMSEAQTGPSNYRWISDREVVHKNRHSGDSDYNIWARKVKKRDHYQCRIDNEGCSGKLGAHHILNWVDFPELRYKINNGITLCQAHHPKKRAEEKRLIPFFQGLVSVSKVLN